jgi:TolB protein
MVRLFFLLLSSSLLLGSAERGQCAEVAPVTTKGFRAESLTSKAYVKLAEFTGSLAATAGDAVKSALEQSGDFVFVGSGKPYLVQASASGGKIQGTLIHPDGKVMFSESYANLSLRANALQFADEIQSVLLGRPGIGMTQLAFVCDASGFKEIYMCDADGANVRQVTHDHSTCVSPDLRNDAAYLSFTSYVSGYPDIYLIDLRNGNRRRIVNAPGTNSGASFSPDGERLAMTMSFSGNPEIYITNPGGLGGRRLTSTAWAESSPAWSPDGKRIAFSANPNGKPSVFIMPSAGGSATQVMNGFQYATEPNWSPDGNLLAATVRQGSRLSIAVTDLHLGTTRVVAEGQDPSWGVDGRHLLYVQRDHLILHHIGNDTKRTIISNLGHVSQPTWSR